MTRPASLVMTLLLVHMLQRESTFYIMNPIQSIAVMDQSYRTDID